jgi:dihydroorotate dehydrogenase
VSDPIYDINKTYLENAEQGPFFSGVIPSRELSGQTYDFLGTKVNSRIGVFAGPLLNARWVKLAADLGYDTLVYKTIRSREHEGHPLPNIVYLDCPNPLDPGEKEPFLSRLDHTPQLESLAITNSFGMPSRSPAYLMKDIPEAENSLHRGQALIVSITGEDKQSFIEAALLAVRSGAKILEANFSCPNVSHAEGQLYLHSESCFQVAKAITGVIGERPLIVKVGAFCNAKDLLKVIIALKLAGVEAISGINTLPARPVPPLDLIRSSSGLCGAPIRSAGLEFISQARHILNHQGIPLTLIGGGGILLPEHFNEYFEAGADFAFTATGMMWNPLLAHHYHQMNPKRAYAHT